jgi:hypothetical protein
MRILLCIVAVMSVAACAARQDRQAGEFGVPRDANGRPILDAPSPR